MRPGPSIAFIDNNVQHIYRSIEALHEEFPNVHVFVHQDELSAFIESKPVDVLLINLDLLPDDGPTLVKTIKGKSEHPVPFFVIYSHKQESFVQEQSLNAGADAFINFHHKPAILKPFVKQLLKRRGVQQAVKTRGNALVLDAESHMVYHKGLSVQLPKKEFSLLRLLYENTDKFFSKNEIATAVWKDKTVAYKRTIDVHIYNIRQLLGRNVIQTQKGKGYRLLKKLTRALSVFFVLYNPFRLM